MLLRSPLFLLAILCGFPALTPAAPVSSYTPVFLAGSDSAGATRVAIRSFRQDGEERLLLVDPLSLRTRVAAKSAFRPLSSARSLEATPFLRALERYSRPPYPLQNHGLVHGEKRVEGVFLTMDLCPSVRPMEKEMLEELQRKGEREGKAVPLAAAVTGAWMEKHPAEMEFLRSASEKGTLSITWVNHSWSHPYRPEVALENNFLLTDRSVFEEEVLKTERGLLEWGLLPSPFFRYPGLVSDGELARRLRALSLIPLGSDAWLAKGEKPRPGSIVLVHGNGNEPKGISLLMPLLREKNTRFLPLQQALSGMPEEPRKNCGDSSTYIALCGEDSSFSPLFPRR